VVGRVTSGVKRGSGETSVLPAEEVEDEIVGATVAATLEVEVVGEVGVV